MTKAKTAAEKAKTIWGRPTVMTDEVLRKLEIAFSYGMPDNEACFYADIASSTFYEYCKNNPDFQERKEALKERPIMMARETVVKNLTNPSFATWYLSRKRKLEFSERTETDVTTKGEVITPTHDIMKIAAEVSKALKEKKTK